MIPQNKINQLIKHKNLLTQKQQQQILEALQSRGRLIIELTVKQGGGFLESLLASIRVPLLLSAIMGKMRGKGLQVDRLGRGLKVEGPYQPPPFYGMWEKPVGMMGMEQTKKKTIPEEVFYWGTKVLSTGSHS